MRAALDSSPEVTIYRQYVDALGLGYDVDVARDDQDAGVRREPGPPARHGEPGS